MGIDITNVANQNNEPLFAGRIDVVSGTLWSTAFAQFHDLLDNQTVLVKWTLNTTNQRITIYTLERRLNQWERWIRVWPVEEYPSSWDHVYCNTSPDDIDLDQYDRDLVCSVCYDLE